MPHFFASEVEAQCLTILSVAREWSSDTLEKEALPKQILSSRNICWACG